MHEEKRLYYASSDNDNYLAYCRKIASLPYGSLVFIDIDGTAVQSANGMNLIRHDFDRIFRYIEDQRRDLSIFSISYRSKLSGIPELADYHFTASIYMEDMRNMLSAIPRGTRAQTIILFLNQIDEFVEDYQLAAQLLDGAIFKLQFLIVMFAEECQKIALLDDGEDGKIAEILGIGIRVRS